MSKTAEEHLEIALGGNMNVSTLTPFALAEIMQEYADQAVKQERERIARHVISARDAFLEEDFKEVYHQIYGIADPEYSKYEPWKEFEELLNQNKGIEVPDSVNISARGLDDYPDY